MDEQKLLREFEADMNDMEKCCTYKRSGDKCTISCKKGLWSVSGPYGLQLINEASHYFEQYKSDGEYHEFLGGKNPLEIAIERASKPTNQR